MLRVPPESFSHLSSQFCLLLSFFVSSALRFLPLVVPLSATVPHSVLLHEAYAGTSAQFWTSLPVCFWKLPEVPDKILRTVQSHKFEIPDTALTNIRSSLRFLPNQMYKWNTASFHPALTSSLPVSRYFSESLQKIPVHVLPMP